MYNNLHMLLGPPGTGKTTRLLKIVEETLKAGTPANRIAFVSFTKKATEEARDRAVQTLGLGRNQFQWFRTLHSFAFRCLGMTRNEVLDKNHYREIGALIGVPMSGYTNFEDDEDAGKAHEGDSMLFVINLARIMEVPLDYAFDKYNNDERIDFAETKQLAATIDDYKRKHGMCDYCDMIARFALSDDPYIPSLHTLIVDEAQDLSRLQWRMVRKLYKAAEVSYLAGDDDQAIYEWAGASVDDFIRVGREAETCEVLDKSYRLPRAVYERGLDIIDNVEERLPKDWTPREEQGYVETYPDLSHVDMGPKTGSWLVLVRNNFLIPTAVQFLRESGLPYQTRRWSPVTCENLKAIRMWERLRKGGSLTLEEVKEVYGKMPPRREFVDPKRRNLKGADPDGQFTLAVLKEHHGLNTERVWYEALMKIHDEEREYYRAVLKGGEPLNKPPRITVSSIHGAKGGEADNVLVMPDVSYRTYDGIRTNADCEHRVFYVAATRAKHALHIIQPQTDRFYEPILDG